MPTADGKFIVQHIECTDQDGRVIIYNKVVIGEEPPGFQPYIGRGLMTIERPKQDPETGDLVWEPHKMETMFPIHPSNLPGQSELKRLQRAFNRWDKDLETKREQTQKELREYVAAKEAEAAAAAKAFEEAEAKRQAEGASLDEFLAPKSGSQIIVPGVPEGAAPGGLFLPNGQPADTPKLIVPPSVQERHINRGEE